MTENTSAAPVGAAASEAAPATTPSTKPASGSAGKIATGCFSIFVFLGMLVLGLSFAFLGGLSKYETPLADALGTDGATLVSILEVVANTVFAVSGFVVFLLTMLALFHYSTTKKEDPAKGKFGWKSVLWGTLLLILLIGWAGTYFALEAKMNVVSQPKPKPPIVTDPQQTVGLIAPVEVTFDAGGTANVIDLKKYKIISYLWDFGDGQNGTGVHIAHTYEDKGTKNGTFPVQLTLSLLDQTTGSIVKNQDYKTIVSIADVKTIVQFTATPEKGNAPLKVQFDASASKDPDGSIKAYEWDFNEDDDYTDATGPKAQYTFEKNGDYKVSLRVTDNSGNYQTSEKLISVSDEYGMQAVIKVSGEPNGKFLINKAYLFDAGDSTSPDGTINKYEWNFGDGTGTKKSKTVTYGFKQEGVYEVTLKVTDEKGNTATKSQKIIIGNPPRVPKAIIDTMPIKGSAKSLTGAAPFEVEFSAQNSTDPDNNITEYRWDFESDGRDDQFGPVVTKVFEKAGTYKVTLTVQDSDDNESKEILFVTVTPPGLSARMTATPNFGTVPLVVSFDASASSYPDGQIIGYEWDFGDKTPKRQDAAKLSYKYNSVGVFNATVTAIAADGKRNAATALVTVQVVPVKACFQINKHQGVAPFDVIFDSTCSTGTIGKYRWDLDGDGALNDSREPNVTYTYKKAGTYKVKLEVTDQQGVVDTFEDSITVTE